VNPRGGKTLGERSYPSLRDIDVEIDSVDVFRPPEEAEGIAGEAIAIGAKTLWFQPGTHTEEAIALARAAGLTVVAKKCMGVTHGKLGLGPGPHVSSDA
jgi:predicted CoA-binding protein